MPVVAPAPKRKVGDPLTDLEDARGIGLKKGKQPTVQAPSNGAPQEVTQPPIVESIALSTAEIQTTPFDSVSMGWFFTEQERRAMTAMKHAFTREITARMRGAEEAKINFEGDQGGLYLNYEPVRVCSNSVGRVTEVTGLQSGGTTGTDYSGNMWNRLSQMHISPRWSDITGRDDNTMKVADIEPVSERLAKLAIYGLKQDHRNQPVIDYLANTRA
ncbi:MAG: hypothetical protein KKD39_04230 [Candidatus Altiarchaeota archaeon]|nr:hypothetical protein [Candidatus Altiarchaeota archaeon]